MAKQPETVKVKCVCPRGGLVSYWEGEEWEFVTGDITEVPFGFARGVPGVSGGLLDQPDNFVEVS